MTKKRMMKTNPPTSKKFENKLQNLVNILRKPRVFMPGLWKPFY